GLRPGAFRHHGDGRVRGRHAGRAGPSAAFTVAARRVRNAVAYRSAWNDPAGSVSGADGFHSRVSPQGFAISAGGPRAWSGFAGRAAGAETQGGQLALTWDYRGPCTRFHDRTGS